MKGIIESWLGNDAGVCMATWEIVGKCIHVFSILMAILFLFFFWKLMINLVGTILGDGQCRDIWGHILEVHLVRNSSMSWTWRCGRVVLGVPVKTV